jgi:FKBP-type peptidyl-prolyl cis-trans isomerase FkpA
MKKILFCGCIVLMCLTSCLKGAKCKYDACAIVAPTSEIQAVQAYLSANSITAVQHCSGLFYTIDNPGTGKSPEACSSVSVTYKGMLTNGSTFDQQSSPVAFNLGSLIIGWKNGLPLLKEGGKIHLYVPPSLGYGASAAGPIPANSILIFEVSLVTVN